MQKLQPQPLPADTQSRLATAIIWHRAGRLKEAAGMYRLLLEEAPENPDILHLLGLVGHQMGHSDFAVRQIIRAVDRNPGKATYHASLGQVFLALKDYGHAVMALSNAARLEPDNADHLANLGHALDAVGAPREAAATYAALVQLSPGLAEAWINLANALPTGPRKDSLHRLSLALNPAHAIGHYNAARAAFSSSRHTEAVGLYRRTLAIDPALAEAHGNLAMLLPNTVSSGKLDFYAAALALEPAHSGIRTDAGLALLARGDLKRGWALHEARLAKKSLAEDRGTGLPRWRGEPLAGKTILVWREQGIGDEILFASCLPDLIARAKGGKIFV
ncbi:MAG: tetratricopeptide repeat protein, partial [Alphaproteobacteria bacterium]|nr:tetratricopeptide repeat protein [Alphaproteobacteria bacterium]